MNTVITIGRQYGSGGREIGEKLAKLYNIAFYDKELLKRAARESGICHELMENHDEQPTGSFLYNLVMDTYSFGYSSAHFMDTPISQKVFFAQFDTIKKIASEGPCVIVGRCGDYALHDMENCLKIFITASEGDRISRIMERHNVNEDKARDMMVKMDKQRQSYYNFYTSGKWSRSDGYDLCVNSHVLGIDGTVNLLSQFINDFENKRK